MVTKAPLPLEIGERTPPEARALILAQKRRIVQLEAQVASLRDTVSALQARLNLNSTNSSKPPSSDPPRVKRAPPKRRSGKPRGGQKGHRKHTRPLVPPDEVDETVDCKPDTCKQCNATLQGNDPAPERQQKAELPPVKPHVTEYRLHRLPCAVCGATTKATLPPGVSRGAFGPRLLAVVGLLLGDCRLSKRQVQRLLRDLFGLRIALGMVCKVQQRLAESLDAVYAELAEYVRTQSVGADETGWREAKKKAWLWVVVGQAATVFRIAGTRGATVIKEMLGVGFTYVVGCDRAKMYRGFRRVQWCWAHLRRDFQAMIDRKNEGAKTGQALLDHADVLCAWWHRVRDGTLSRSTFRKYAGNLRAAFVDDLQVGAAGGCAKTAATCRDLLEHEEWLWTFLWHEGVEPTNNASERALRHGVLWRKTSGGTDSPGGSRFVERVLTVVATCRQQGRNVLEYLTACCEASLHNQPAPSLLPQDKTTSQAT